MSDAFFVAVYMEPLRDAEFTQSTNKRLTSATTKTVTLSAVQCAAMCLMDDGCLAIGVTRADDTISCSLATSSSGPYDVVEEADSDVYVRNGHSEGGNSLSES